MESGRENEKAKKLIEDVVKIQADTLAAGDPRRLASELLLGFVRDFPGPILVKIRAMMHEKALRGEAMKGYITLKNGVGNNAPHKLALLRTTGNEDIGRRLET